MSIYMGKEIAEFTMSFEILKVVVFKFGTSYLQH